MAKCISLGKFNKNSKYLLYYLISKFLYEGMAGLKYGSLYKPMKFYEKQGVIKSHKLVIDFFSYVGIALLSLILKRYEPDNKEKQLINKDSTLKLVYVDKTTFSMNKYDIIMVAFFWVCHIQLLRLYYQSNLGYLDYWALEMVITYFMCKKMFKIEIYSHQKLAIYFITIFCSLLILISFILTFINEDDIIYKKHLYFIPVGILSYLIILIIRVYSNCKTKYLIDFKYISPDKLLIAYGIIGAISCFIICILTTFIDCGNNSLELCYMERKGKSYYDSFIIFFDEYFHDSFKIIDIFLILFLIFFNFLTSYFYLLIIQYLSPFYAVCLPSIHYFILQIILLINTFAQGEKEIITSQLAKVIIEISTDFFSLLGIFVYLELIELNICKLNYNLKKSISNRASSEFEINDENKNIND